MAAPGRALEGIFIAKPHLRERKAHFRSPGKETQGGKEVIGGWSGIVAFREPLTLTSINSVGAEWTVPNCYPPKDSVQGGWYTCSSWIGIDGDNLRGDDSSGQALQAGVDSHVMQHSGVLSRWVCAWWEWYPGISWYLPSFPVSPGDRLVAKIDAKSQTNAVIVLKNLTSGVSILQEASAPKGIHLKGNCAEWIVEKMSFAGDDMRLASYGHVSFAAALAQTEAGPLRIGPDNVRHWKIQTDSTDPVDQSVAHILETRDAAGIIQPDTSVQCSYVGPTPTEHLVAGPLSSEPKKYGKPSSGRETFRSTDADDLQEVEEMIQKYIENPKASDLVEGLRTVQRKVSGVRDWHYSGAGTLCRPPGGGG